MLWAECGHTKVAASHKVPAYGRLPSVSFSDHMEDVGWSRKELTRFPCVFTLSNNRWILSDLPSRSFCCSFIPFIYCLPWIGPLGTRGGRYWRSRGRERKWWRSCLRKNVLATEGQEPFLSLGRERPKLSFLSTVHSLHLAGQVLVQGLEGNRIQPLPLKSLQPRAGDSYSSLESGSMFEGGYLQHWAIWNTKLGL